MTQEPVTLTREQLYELVWNEPTRTVAARYGLSDRGLAKICMRLHVPVPGRGFWAKEAAGRELWRPRLRPLPPTAAPNERQVTVSVGAPCTATPAPDTAHRQAVLEKDPDRLIQVPSALVDPHPLVKRTGRPLRCARADQRGMLAPEAKPGLDIRVTRASVDRALLVFDALIKALDARGFPVTCTAEGERRTSVRVLEENIGICLEEKVRQVERKEPPRPSGRAPLNTFLSPSPRYGYVASGDLALRVTDDDFQNARRTWRDGKRGRLEALLNRFMVGLVAVAEAKKLERKRREEREKERDRRRSEEVERQRLRWEEEKKVRLLKEELAAWRSTRDIRDYVAAVQVGVASRGGTEERRKLDDWLRWVMDYADRIDPARRATPPEDPWA